MNKLSSQHCIPCEKKTPPLGPLEIKKMLLRVKGWRLNHDNTAIVRDFEFNNFTDAVNFVDDVAAIAEEEGHHPNLNLHDWNEVTVTLTTHAIKGLSPNDFILAAKINNLKRE